MLGSAQKGSDVDQHALNDAGLGLVRRKSGGGAVLVEPNDMVWVDVILPRHDSLWRDDVGMAFHWLGDVWRRTLKALAVSHVTVHDGAMINTIWSRQICFAGLGPGECLIDGRKAVGISQKRTREGAVFQCSVLLRFDPPRMVSMLTLSDDDKTDACKTLAQTVAAIDVPIAEIEREFLKSLEKIGPNS